MTKQVRFRNFALGARTVVLSCSVACSFICGEATAAQDQHTGTLIPGRAGSSMVQESGRLRSSDRVTIKNAAAKRRAANEAHDTLRRFAGCIVTGAQSSREQRDLVTFLQTAPDDPSIDGKSNKILRENCVYGTGAEATLLYFKVALLRGAIFRQLYVDPRSAPAEAIGKADILTVASPKVSGTFAANQHFGDCIVAADQTAAEGFVRSKVASPEQDAALRSVVARMSGCLTQGLTLQMSRVVLDGLLAEALYRKMAGTGIRSPEGSKVAQTQ